MERRIRQSGHLPNVGWILIVVVTVLNRHYGEVTVVKAMPNGFNAKLLSHANALTGTYAFVGCKGRTSEGY